jgi:GH15 family glucan-1,4-alpha-glucosidase
MSLSGYADPAGDRMRATAARISERLGAGGGLLYRSLSDDGLPGGEGAFGICSFWGAESCALEGRQQDAVRWFETLLRHANDVGLFAEEIDPATGALLGNFPQAFTHVGLINTALTLAECAGYPQSAPDAAPAAGRHV